MAFDLYNKLWSCGVYLHIDCSVKIGLFGKIRPLQNDLNQIARTTDTSTRRGMRSVLTGMFSLYCSLTLIYLLL